MTTELQWGETPFDKLSREEMRMLLCKLYTALNATSGALAMSRAAELQIDPNSVFWGPHGNGGRIMMMADQALNPIKREFGGDEAISRAYFRYADELLFDWSSIKFGSSWAVCPKCGVMIGYSRDGDSAVGTSCAGTRRGGSCTGTLRALSWDDLRPEAKK
jgi:hypothetical protein